MKQLILVLLLAVLCMSCHADSANNLRYRWFYYGNFGGLNDNAKIDELIALMKHAKAAGYNGFEWADPRLRCLDLQRPAVLNNVAKVRSEADKLGLEIYPSIFDIGCSTGLLCYDNNLVEGLPVKDAVFKVSGMKAEIDRSDLSPKVVNGGFEQAYDSAAERFRGIAEWEVHGTAISLDKNVSHNGTKSVRFAIQSRDDDEARISQSFPIEPFRQYHIGGWVKLKDIVKSGFRVSVETATTNDSGAEVMSDHQFVQPTIGGWQRFDLIGNSFNNHKLTLAIGIGGIKSGTVWIDDAVVEEVGIYNILRREGCPVVVSSAADGTVYTEGKDFARIVDPKMDDYNVKSNRAPDTYHDWTAIGILPGSRIKDGDRLKVSYYHSLRIYQLLPCACPTHPKTRALMTRQVANVNKYLDPKGIFMDYDEIRTANWCTLCQSKHETPAELIADNVRYGIKEIRKTGKGQAMITWNDMFDPNSNGTKEYYYVNGDFRGAWKGLDSSVIIANWAGWGGNGTTKFFADLGNPQILCGFYDHDPGFLNIGDWLKSARSVPGSKIVGVMYTTWLYDYGELEKFARDAWGGAQ